MKQLRNMKDVIGMGNVEVGRLVRVQEIKTYIVGVEVELPSFFTSALNTGERSTSSCGRITTKKDPGNC